MRYLNKIVFIHSAHINYAEINLDGNVHFIGTQGVGKSTLLRAILFFYNADTINLGIPREKQSYPEYYFPYSNSYIIYEIVRDDGHFCVVSYKSQNRVCFRLIDGPYQEEYFFDEKGASAPNWQDIAQRLDARRVIYIKRKIDNYGEYRDILYGNQGGKKGEFKRYALMESKEYANIPKTIQNVFLNSKMEADFIKQTIILSLENDITIDLNNYAHHLKDFDLQLEDIKRFNEPKIIKQADAIINCYHNIRNFEREKIEAAKALGYALGVMRKQIHPLQQAMAAAKVEIAKERDRQERFEIAHQKAKEKLLKEAAIVEDNLKKANSALRRYDESNMADILERSKRKPTLEAEAANLIDEKDLLLQQQAALSSEFEQKFKQLENQNESFVNTLDKAANKIDQAFFSFKEEANKLRDQAIETQRQNSQQALKHAREHEDQAIKELAIIETQLENLRKMTFLEAEISEEREGRRNLNAIANELSSKLKDYNRQQEDFKNNLQFELDKGQSAYMQARNSNEQAGKALQTKVQEIDGFLQNHEAALYTWLTKELPGWENTIGKVIDEKNILFETGLEPRLLPKNQGFYGIELDLDQVSKSVKSVEEYQYERTQHLDALAKLGSELEALEKDWTDQQEKLRKKAHKQLKSVKELQHKCNYEIEQNLREQKESDVKIDALRRRAASEKEEALKTADEDLHKANEGLKEARISREKLDAELDKQIRSLQNEFNKNVKVEAEKAATEKQELQDKIQQQKQHFLQLKKKIEAERNQEFAAKGIDTVRIQALEASLLKINLEFEFIANNVKNVAVYEHEKATLIDQIPEFRLRKKGYEGELLQLHEKHARSMEKVRKELNTLEIKLYELRRQLEENEADQKAYQEFELTELHSLIAQYLEIGDAQEPQIKSKTGFAIRQLIDKLKDIHYDKLRTQSELITKTVVDFLGKFSENNIFQFKKQFAELETYLDFASMLADFVGENKIVQIEKEVNERFAYIISTIGRETSNMMSETGKIQQVVRKINDDFALKNFVLAIKSIQLRIEDSKNEIVQLLIAIKKFNDENAHQFGKASLFTGDGQDKSNKEAVDLLKQFHRKTAAQGEGSKITLADSFELRFRIEENTNDTGWVEKLSNVGSEGTDILVKAMLNIMLLNVFKEGASKRFKDFKLHCMMDEIGKLHPSNVRGILQFGNERNILLINSSPIENDALAFKHIYKLHKDENSKTKVSRLITTDN